MQSGKTGKRKEVNVSEMGRPEIEGVRNMILGKGKRNKQNEIRRSNRRMEKITKNQNLYIRLMLTVLGYVQTCQYYFV